MTQRQVILDTETTGLSVEKGHRLIEVGCLEMINRRMTERTFHRYINPQRAVEPGAIKVHGITDNFLADKPLFADVAEELFAFIDGAELIIHNAPFDMGFLNAEFAGFAKKYAPLENHCQVIDTLIMARNAHPGQQNTLDALCRRYGVDNAHRDLHGALLDAELLAQVYLRMTGGQSQLFAADQAGNQKVVTEKCNIKLQRGDYKLPVIQPDAQELALHQAFMEKYFSQ